MTFLTTTLAVLVANLLTVLALEALHAFTGGRD